MQKNKIGIETVVKIIKKLYWLGLIGIAGSVFDIPILKLFYLFFLLAIIDFILSLIIVLRTESTDETINELKFLLQNLGMLIGIPFIYIRNMFQLPNVDTYTPEIHYSLPFGECWTVANGGNNKETSHSWSICNQRYAYDFYIQKNGSTFSGNGKNVTDYFCYGKTVLAAADGIVIEIKNLFEDTPIPEKEEVDCHASDVRGNYIIIQHSEHEYSTIAHIKKDSFCVKVGDKVYRGQQIACCGNSGNTSEPHIHFQVQQGKSFLLSASLPIWFEKIRNHSISHNSPHISRGDIVENQNK